MARLNFKIDRGTTFIFHYKYLKDCRPASLEGATLYFTAKKKEWDGDTQDGTAAILKTVTSFDDAVNGETNIELTPQDTYIEPGKYHCDIVVVEASGERHQTNEGFATVDGGQTNRGL